MARDPNSLSRKGIHHLIGKNTNQKIQHNGMPLCSPQRKWYRITATPSQRVDGRNNCCRPNGLLLPV